MGRSALVAKQKRASRPARLIPVEVVERRIHMVRGQKVMLDRDLAGLYGVTTGNLNLAVRRNRVRFPDDFVFQMTLKEVDSLLLQTARAKRRGGRRTPPYAFTEQGVAMLSSVLRSHRAALVNITIMRAFVRMREVLATHKDLAHKLEVLEAKVMRHDSEIERHKVEVQEILRAIRQLIQQPIPPRRRIGFVANPNESSKTGKCNILSLKLRPFHISVKRNRMVAGFEWRVLRCNCVAGVCRSALARPSVGRPFRI